MSRLGTSAKITADPAQRGRLAEHLEEIQGAELEFEELDVGDFLLDGETVVEYKSGTDFILAVVDKEVFDTANRMKAHYRRPVFLVEGDHFTARFHQTPFDVHWAIGHLTGALEIPVLYSPSPKDSAMLLYTLAVEAQQKAGDAEQPLRPNRPETRREGIRFLVEGLPGVDPEMARALLRHFGTARAVFQAGREELLEVEGMREKVADRISDLLDSKKGK
ncbi:ERCC4 domain-containing protein [Thiohalorhabdus sp. Cl-TMA]|uniref:ERCC4 domain-containing protein n=1 Tax=Thiohalorhabdus methylotrophus TaxID=3242694 RepID=A0ABV4TXG6_9GAMM